MHLFISFADAFRLLSHKNFFTVDENYKRSPVKPSSPPDEPSLPQMAPPHPITKIEPRLQGGKEGCPCMRMLEEQLKRGEEPTIPIQQLPPSEPDKNPEASQLNKTSSVGTQTSLEERKHGGSDKDTVNKRKKHVGCFCCRTSGSSSNSNTSVAPRTELWSDKDVVPPPKPPRTYATETPQSQVPPPKPARLRATMPQRESEQLQPAKKPSRTYRTVEEYLGPPRPRRAPSTIVEQEQENPSNRLRTQSIASQYSQPTRARTSSIASQQPPVQSRTQSTASQQTEILPNLQRIYATAPPPKPPRNEARASQYPPRNEEGGSQYTHLPPRQSYIPQPLPAVPIRTSQARRSTKPRRIFAPTEPTEAATNADFDDKRIVRLEDQIAVLHTELSGIKRSFIPQEELIRYGVLAQRLQELNGVLADMKQTYLGTKTDDNAKADVEPLSTATSRSKSEQFESCAYFSNNNLGQRFSGGGAGGAGAGSKNNPPDICQRAHDNAQRVGLCCRQRTPSVATETTPPASAAMKTDSYVQASAEQREQETQATLDSDRNDDNPIIRNDSSFCLYCEGKNVPVLKANLLDGILRIAQQHNASDLALTVVVQRNDLYHINISVMRTGQALGCLLATEEAMWEANRQRIFDNFLTFFILDTRNTTAQKMMILSHTTFEIAKR